MDKLRECPFCGKPAAPDHLAPGMVRCSNSDCHSSFVFTSEDHWNSRPSPWHPGTEKPEKEGEYLTADGPKDQPSVMRYKSGHWFWFDVEDGYSATLEPWMWMSIPTVPPLPEVSQ